MAMQIQTVLGNPVGAFANGSRFGTPMVPFVLTIRTSKRVKCMAKDGAESEPKLDSTTPKPKTTISSPTLNVTSTPKPQLKMVAEMRMLRWMCSLSLKDRVKNVCVREKLGVGSIEDKLREARLRWFGHVYRRPAEAPVRACESVGAGVGGAGGRRPRGRPKKSLREVILPDLKALRISKDLALDRNRWRDLIRVEG